MHTLSFSSVGSLLPTFPIVIVISKSIVWETFRHGFPRAVISRQLPRLTLTSTLPGHITWSSDLLPVIYFVLNWFYRLRFDKYQHQVSVGCIRFASSYANDFYDYALCSTSKHLADSPEIYPAVRNFLPSHYIIPVIRRYLGFNQLSPCRSGIKPAITMRIWNCSPPLLQMILRSSIEN